MSAKPFIYAHELLSNGGGVWLGCDSEEITLAAHIDGETGEEVIALYHAADYKALLSLNAELLEALEYVIQEGQVFTSAIEGDSHSTDFEEWAVRARSVIAKARSQS